LFAAFGLLKLFNQNRRELAAKLGKQLKDDIQSVADIFNAELDRVKMNEAAVKEALGETVESTATSRRDAALVALDKCRAILNS
jgi:hypothetical protein